MGAGKMELNPLDREQMDEFFEQLEAKEIKW